jgi:hypothetical protein
MNQLTVLFSKRFMYLNAATGQEVKPLIQMYLPELYSLIENETDVSIIYNVAYSYLVTQVVSIYNMVMELFGSDSMQNTMQMVNSVVKFGQNMLAMSQQRK